jgi:zinc transporter
MDTLPVNIPGLVWAYRFSPESKKAVRLQNSATAAELTADDGFYWLHLNLADARVPALLDTLGVMDDAKSALTT